MPVWFSWTAATIARAGDARKANPVLTMNMEALERTRKRPDPGDIFVYRIKGMDYGFGRVIRTDARMDSCRDLILIYIYDAFAPNPEEIPRLRKGRLLLPPELLLDHGPWGRGHFMTVRKTPLRKIDVLKTHCFYSGVHDCYMDEYERRLPRKSYPCGIRAGISYVGLDAAISYALGIEPDPDTVPER